MGLLSWFKGSTKPEPKPKPSNPNPHPTEIPGMNGAVEVPRAAATPAANVTVFEFGSANTDKVTLAGYCPVSEELEPCRWELLPAPPNSDAPQFRVVF